jgi:hypothetical protein
MASTIVTSGRPAEAGAGPGTGDEETSTTPPREVNEVDAAAPFAWADGSDGFEPPEDRFSSFFGPTRSRPNRIALGVVAAIFVVALVSALVVTLSGGRNAAPKHTTHPKTAAPPNAAAIAGSALLASSDFPSGWTGAGTAAVTHGPAWSAKLARCVGVPASVARARPPKMSSPVFTSSDKTAALEESVSVYPTAAQALAEYNAIAKSKTPGCIGAVGAATLRESIQKEAGSAATVGNVVITAIPPGTLKPHETGIRVAIPITTNAGQLTINSTEVDFVKGRLFEQLNFNGNGNPFPPLLEVQLIDTAMLRAAS